MSCRIKINNEYIKSFTKKDTFNSVEEFQQAIYKVYGLDSIAAPVSLNKKDGVSFLQASVLTNANILLTVRAPFLKNITQKDGRIKTGSKKDSNFIYIPALQDENNNPVPDINTFTTLWLNNFFSPTADSITSLIDGGFVDTITNYSNNLRALKQSLSDPDAVLERGEISKKFSENINFINSIIGNGGVIDYYTNLYREINQELSEAQLKKLEELETLVNETREFLENELNQASSFAADARFKEYKYFSEKYLDELEALEKESEKTVETIEEGTEFSVVKSFGTPIVEDFDTSKIDNAEAAKIILTEMVNNAIINGINNQNVNFRIKYERDSSDFVQNRILKDNTSSPLNESQVNTKTSVVGIVEKYNTSTKQWERVYLKIKPESSRGNKKITLSDISGVDALSYDKLSENFELTTDLTQAYNISYELGETVKSSPVVTFRLESIERKDKIYQEAKKRASDALNAGTVLYSTIQTTKGIGAKRRPLSERNYSIENISIDNTQGSPYRGAAFIGNTLLERGTLPKDKKQEIMDLISYSYSDMESEVLEGVVAYIKDLIEVGDFIPVDISTDLMNRINIPNRTLGISVVPDPDNPNNKKIQITVFRYKQDGKFIVAAKKPNLVVSSKEPNLARFIEMGLDAARIHIPKGEGTKVGTYKRAYKVINGKVQKVDWSVEDQHKFILDNTKTKYYNSDGVNVNLDRVFVVSKKIETYNPSVKEEKKDPVVVKNVNKAPLVTPTPTPTPLSIERLDIEIGDEITTETLANAEKALRESAQTDIVDLSGLDPAEISGNLPVLTKEQEAELEAAIRDKGTVIEEFYLDTEDVQETSDFLSLAEQYDSTQEKLPKEISMSGTQILDIFDMVAPEFKSSLNPNSAALLTLAQQMLGEDTIFIFGSNTDTNSSVASFSLYEEGVEGLKDSESIEDKIMYDRLVKAAPDRIGSIKKVITINSNTYLKLKELQSKQQRSPQQQSQLNSLSEKIGNSVLEEIVHAMTFDKLLTQEVQSSEEFKDLTNIVRDLRSVEKSGKLKLTEEEKEFFDYYIGAEIGTNDEDVSIEKLAEFLVSPHRKELRSILSKAQKNIQFPKKDYKSLYEFVLDKFKNLFEYLFKGLLSQSPQLEEVVSGETLAIILNKLHQADNSAESIVKNLNVEVGDQIEAFNSDPKVKSAVENSVKGTKEEEEFLKSSEIQAGVQPPINPTSTSEVGDRIKNKIKGGLKNPKTTLYSIDPAYSSNFSTMKGIEKMFKKADVKKGAAAHIDSILSNILWGENIFSDFIQNNLSTEDILEILSDTLLLEIEQTPSQERKNYLTYLRNNLSDIWLKNSNLFKASIEKSSDITPDIKNEFNADKDQEFSEKEEIGIDGETLSDQDVMDITGGVDSSRFQERTEQKLSSVQEAGRLAQIFVRMLPKLDLDKDGNIQYEYIGGEDGIKVVKTQVDSFGNYKTVNYTEIWNALAEVMQGCLTIDEMIEALNTKHLKFKEMEVFRDRVMAIGSTFNDNLLIKDLEKSFQKILNPTMLVIEEVVEEEKGIKSELDEILEAEGITTNVKDSKYNTENSAFNHKIYSSTKLDAINIQNVISGLFREKYEKNMDGIFPDYKAVLNDITSNVDMAVLRTPSKSSQWKNLYKYWANVGVNFEAGNKIPEGLKRQLMMQLSEFTIALVDKMEAMEKKDVPASEAELIAFDVFDFVKNTQTTTKGKFPSNSAVVSNLMDLFTEVLPYSTSNMSKNAEGENQSNLHNFSSYLINLKYLSSISTANSKQEQINLVKKEIPRLNNPIAKYSWVIGKLEDGVKIEPVNISGTQKEDSGVNTINLKYIPYLRQQIHTLLKEGFKENLRAETASSSFGFRLVSNKTVLPVGKRSIKKDTETRLNAYFKGEIERIFREKVNKVLGKGKYNFKYENQREQFTIMSGMLSGEFKNALQAKMNEYIASLPQGTLTEISNQGEALETSMMELFAGIKELDINGNKVNAFIRLNSEIGNYLKSEVLDFKNYLKNETFIDGSISPNVEVDRTHPIFADTFIQKEIDELPNITGESQIDTFLSYYLSNFIIMSIEETILFHGELGQQDKFYKRSKSNMSNGTPVIINDRLKELLKRDSITGSFSETLGGKKPEYYENPDRMKSFIISDDEMSINDAQAANMKLGLVESLLMTAKEFGRKLTREQAEARAEEIISGYSKSTVSDGGGFVHPDAYRLMLMGVGAWSREREEGYLYEMVKYKEKKGISLNESEMELKSLVETKIKKLGIYYTFPVVKFQYRGAGFQEGEMNQTVTAVEMLDKFALTPLFPSFVEGKVGEDILRAMTNSSSAYGKFASGTKIGQFEMNNLSDFKSIETPNGIHFVQTQYLKEQVKTPDKVKKESLFGSQVRKLMISNLSINGKFIESIFPFYKEWKDSQSEFAVRERDALYKELGVDEGTLSRLKSYQERGESTEGINLNIDLSKLVKLMRKEVEKRDIPEALKEFFYNDSLTDQEVGDVFFEMSLSPSIVENMLYSVLKNRIVKVKFPGAHLVQSPSSLFTSKNEEDLNSQGRDLEYYRVDEKTGEILPAQCKVALQGDFKNLLNHPLVKEYGYGLEALNKALKNPEVRKALKDHITIFAYRIPTQGFNSMDVLEIVEFLPEPLGNTIIPPPQIVTKSGTDYDYDKMPTVFPQIGEDGQLIKGESYRLIQASKDILLNKLNFYRLVTPNTTEYVIDRLNNILEKIYGGTDVNPDPKNTNIFSPVTHLKKWLAVKIKDLLGVAAVNNTYYSLMQEAGFVLNEKYTIEGNELTFTPKLLSEKEREKIVNKITDPFIIGEDVDKLEIINQFINLFVDAASNDIAGYTNIKKENIGFVIMQTMVGVPFDRILKFIHQPIIYRYHQYVDSLVANGNTLSEAKKYALEELLGISLIKETKYGFANKSNQELWEEVIDISRSVEEFDSSDLESQLITKDRIAGVSNARFRNSPSQAAALAYYLIGLQEADLLREAQSFTNHDTTISPSLGVSGIREEMYKKIEEADLISQDSLQKIKNGLIGFLNIHEDFEKLSNIIFPILGSPIHQEILGEMGTNVFESKREKFVNSFNNDFLLFLIQNFDANFQERYSKLKEMQQNGSLLVEWNRLKKEYNLEDTSLAKHLYPVNTKKGSGANPALFMGLDNSSEEFNKILSEIRQMQSLVGNDKRATDLRNFANNLVELGFYQTGFTPSRIYMLKVLPPDFLLGYKDIFKTFNNLSIDQKKIVYSTFKSTFLRHQILNFGSSFIDYFGSSYDGERNAARNDKDRFVLPNLYSKALVPKLNQYNETLNKKLEKEKEQTLANTQNNPQAFFALVDSLPVGKFSTEVSTISIETVKPVVEPVAETIIKREVTPEIIKTLKPNEVFVFGANTAGGHGGGTAGLAQRGIASSNYTALSIGTKGKWAEYGVVDRLMEGTEGKSFGIVTKAATISGTSLKIGSKRSVPLSRIEESIDALIKTAIENPNLKFLVTKFGTNMAGFTIEEMRSLLVGKNLPDNIVLPKEFEFRGDIVSVAEPTQPKVKGINIRSDKNNPNSLANRLTNPNWYAKDLYDVETEYKANQAKVKAKHLNAQEALLYDMDLMYQLQLKKFRKNPELIDEINAKGGLEFIKQSSHIVGTKGSRWEGKGMDSNFIKVLAKTYETVAKELDKFVDSTQVKPEPKPQPIIQPQVSSVKPTINLSKEWRGDLESRPVYTTEGVNTMRTKSANPNEHFGNPFSEAGYGNTIKVNSISDAVLAYKDWLLYGVTLVKTTNEVNLDTYLKPFESQRQWILDQINQGILDGATLLYDKKLADRGEGSHAEALAEVVEQLRTSTKKLPQVQTKIQPQEKIDSKYELFPGVYANLGQRTAIDKIEEFLSKDSSKVKDQKENLFLLKGRGGTGKTTIIKKALEGVPGVVIGATVADEARQVLQENMKGYTTATMASLLGLIVDYKEGKEFFRKRTEREIDEYEAKGGTIPIKKASILVIDEASMISDALWEILMDMKKPNTKIIFMGDNVQIPPIQENGTSKDSPVWNLITSDNFSELSERMRQKAESPILGITDLYANNVENIQNNRPFVANPLKLRQTTINDKGEGVIYVKENSELVDMYIKDFKSSKDLKEAVVVAARLDSVAFINNSIRKKLFNTEEPYVVGERIRVNTPYVRDNQVVMTNGLKGEINSVKKTKLDGVDLDVYNITATFQTIAPNGEVEFNTMNFNTIDPQDSKKFAAAKSKLAKAAEVFRKGTPEYKIAWAKYYHLKGLIVDIGYAYAITAHKVQGSTYNSTYVLENDVMSFPGGTEQQNRMMYTAVSRPRKKLVIFNPAQAIDPITKYFIDEVDLVKVLENIPELKGKDHESIITNFFAKFNDECNGDRAIAVNFIYSGLKRQDKKEITLNLLKECF